MAAKTTSPEKVAKVKECLAQGMSIRNTMHIAGVSKNVVLNISKDPGHYDYGDQAKPHGQELRPPAVVHFNEDDMLVPTQLQPKWERCREYRGQEGCGGQKQVGAECLVCRDRQEQLALHRANLDWEEYMEELLGPSPSPLSLDSTIHHEPIPGKVIIVEDVATIDENAPGLGSIQVTPIDMEPSKVDKVIQEVKKNLIKQQKAKQKRGRK